MPRRSAPTTGLARFYEEDALWYRAQLPLEHFANTTCQSAQYHAAAACFGLIKLARPDIHLFSELLIQYPVPGEERPGRVVPDHFVVLHPDPLDVYWSFATPLQPVGPFLTMDWLAKNNPRKDYAGYRVRYAQALRVPYALVFSTDDQTTTLSRLVGGR